MRDTAKMPRAVQAVQAFDLATAWGRTVARVVGIHGRLARVDAACHSTPTTRRLRVTGPARPRGIALRAR